MFICFLWAFKQKLKKRYGVEICMMRLVGTSMFYYDINIKNFFYYCEAIDLLTDAHNNLLLQDEIALKPYYQEPTRDFGKKKRSFFFKEFFFSICLFVFCGL